MTTGKGKVAATMGAILCLTAATAAAPPRTDAFGDLLPPGALMRLGTVRWRVCAGFFDFMPDGKTLVTGEERAEFMIHFWDVATGKVTGKFRFPISLAEFALSPDGKMLALSGPDVCFVSVPDGKELRRIGNPTNFFHGLCFSRDGKLLAGIDDKSIVHVWNAADGKEILRKQDENDSHTGQLAFSPDGEKLSVACRKGQFHILEVATGKVLLKREVKNDPGGPTRADFSPDGKKLLWLGEHNHSFALRDASSGEPLLSFSAPDETPRPVAFSPDGKHIASIDESGVPPSISLWDAATGKEIHKLTAPGVVYRPAKIVFSPDGKRLAASGYCVGLLHVWDVETGKDLSQVSEHQAIVCSAAFSSDGRTVLTGCADNVIRVWDAEKGTVARRIEVDRVFRDPSAYDIVFSKNRKVAAVLGGGRLKDSLWNLDSGKRRAELDDAGNKASRADFAPDGRTLASRGDDKSGIQFWDSATGKKVSRSIIDADSRGAFAIAPDGKTLIVQRKEVELSLWDVALGKEIRKWPLPRRARRNLLFAPTGSMIAEAGHGGVDLWDAVTGKERPALNAPEGARSEETLFSLAFSADGKTLAAASATGVIYLWDVNTRKVRDVLRGHRGWVTSLDFSPDGSRLISGGYDATALIWDLTGIADEKGAKTLTPERLAALWNELADADVGKAWRAGWRLAADPATSVPFLQKHFKRGTVDAHLVAQLLTALDSDDFEERESATRGLAKLGDLAEPALRKALEETTSLEARRRMEELVNKLDATQVRDLRCVEVLEHIGSPEARRLLDELGKGAEGSRLTRDAKTALARLSQRKDGMP